MKSPLDTPTITAHALGELSPAEERLLRMTFHSPVAARDLAEQVDEISHVAKSMERALQGESAKLSLSDAQRNRILELTASPYPAGKSAPLPAIPLVPKPMTKVLQERRQFDRRPARMATYLTLGAAAVVLAFLGFWPSKTTTPTVGRDTMTAGNSSGNGVGEEPTPPKFKVIPISPEKDRNRSDDVRKAVTGIPQSAMDFKTNSTLPPGPVVPSKQLTSTPPKKESAKPELPRTVNVPPQPPTEPTGPLKSSVPKSFAAPK